MEDADFSGYATKADIRCTDGRTITDTAFAHQDTVQVPLVWQHQHDGPENVLGHAILEHRDATHPEGAGIYCYGYFNESERGSITKHLVHHKDVKALSIFANGLVEKVRGKAREVLHGAIQEVSLVLSGANPEAYIDNIRLQHSDGMSETLDEAYIFTGLEIQIPESAEASLAHADEGGTTATTDDEAGISELEVYESMSDEQKEVVHLMIGAAIEETEAQISTGESAEQADNSGDTMTGAAIDNNAENGITHQEGNTDMTRNVFQHNANAEAGSTMTAMDTSHRLTHGQLVTIVENAKKSGSFKEAVLAHAGEYGIDNIELLFPDAQALTQTPEWISRRMEWVSVVINGTKHSPFAKVKTLTADITAPEARAKGYVKGARKLEEVFGLLRRTTSPGTIYKKQKLDRDDMLDITDINVVNWLKAEMRLMIEEEIARAILVGDGRSAMDPDKVKDPMGANDGEGIRSILNDDDLYAIKHVMPANVTNKDTVKGIVRAMNEYKGSGAPTCFISRTELTELMLEEDRFGRPLYENRAALADKMGVSRIETVDLFSEYQGLYCIIVSLSDYTVGTNRGGELTSFEDFDIDFNQHKYLQETRLSGGLTKPFSAVVVTKLQGILAVATQPAYNPTTKVITIPDEEGVVYYIDDVEQPAGDTAPITEDTEVVAAADQGYYLESGTTRVWTYAV